MAFSTLASSQALAGAIVIDNSVMMRWLFNDGSKADQQYAQRTRAHIGTKQLQVIVPYIWIYEASFVTNFYTKKGLISIADAVSHLNALFDLCLVIRGEEMPSELFQFANTHGLSTYDAAYVMLALQQGCAIATLDKAIIKTSNAAGYNVF